MEKFTNNYFERSKSKFRKLCPNVASKAMEGIMQLKGNVIPKGLVKIKKFFNRWDAFSAKSSLPKDAESGNYEKVNLGDKDDPKMVNLGTCCDVDKKTQFIKLLKEYIDVFSWSYKDLKTFKGGQFKNHIILKLGIFPFKKLRTYNPKVLDAIFKEIDKMLKAQIIFLIHHSTWVANIVLVRKKSGEMRICVDFRNLNQESLKDNFALPIMDQILQIVVGSEMMSFLVRFSSYNQICVAEEDQHKTTFTTPWGTISYRRMSFGLINVDATFQHAMDSTFRYLLNKSIMVYLSDMTIFSRK